MKRILLALLLAVAAASSCVFALDYPTKDLTVIVPSHAGGATDVAVRAFVKHFQKVFPRNVNVICIEGPGGAVALTEFLKMNDTTGHTLVVQPSGMPLNHAIGTYGYTQKDFAPVSGIFSGYMTLCVRADSPLKNFADFSARVKADPDFRYGIFSNTPATGILLAIEEFLKVRLKIVDVPGSGKQSELLAGRIDAIADFFSQMKPFLDSRDFRSLGVFTDERLPDYPDIPTFKEMGLSSPLTEQIMGFFAAKGTSPEVVAYLDQSVRDTFDKDPGTRKDLEDLGYVANYKPAGEYDRFLDASFTAYKEKISTLD